LLTRGVSWRLIAATVAGISLAAGVIVLMMRRTAPAAAPQTNRHVLAHKGRILASGGFWIFATANFFAGAAEGAFTFWTATYIQLHHEGTERAGGIGTACFAGGMIVGRILSAWCVPQQRLRALILASALAGSAAGAVLPLAPNLATLYVLLL